MEEWLRPEDIKMCEKKHTPNKKQQIVLIGIGMGAVSSMTGEAAEEIRGCSCLIGARRMLDTARQAAYVCRETGACLDAADEKFEEFCEYRAEQIVSYIGEHPEYDRIGVVLSGDTGFYSGARKLSELLKLYPDRYEIRLVPGISSIVCLAARLMTAWEDGAVVSLHGQDENFIQTVNKNYKTFLLLGGKGTGARMLQRLTDYGMENVTVSVGSRLTYPEERIVTGRPSEISPEDVEGLCTAMILNPHPEESAGPHIRDEEFIRGNVPMTKAEVRAVSLAALELTENAIVYDIGAGTGSVSVEAARSGDRIRVYAVEKKPEAVSLLRQNRRKFRADGIRIIEGEAPDALGGLEPPTHVFVGGSSGSMREILKAVLERNSEVRIVINAISLETLTEVMNAVEDGLLRNVQIAQITAARSRELGTYHMMTGQNPVYIISSGGKERG